MKLRSPSPSVPRVFELVGLDTLVDRQVVVRELTL